MSILFVLIPLSLALVAFAGWAFFWAVGAGQFDDLETPGWDALREEPHEVRSRQAGDA
jgi:cbb3-type cytochrome oxidase maturation protein